jgi:hypothetical protein
VQHIEHPEIIEDSSLDIDSAVENEVAAQLAIGRMRSRAKGLHRGDWAFEIAGQKVEN